LIFFIRGKNVDKTSQNVCIFVAFGRFWRNMFISEGGQNLGFRHFLRILTPSKINIFRQKRPNMTKIHQFWEVLSTCFPLNKKNQNKTHFWSFLIFSLLSYIEIYIEYRETARREGCIPYMGSQPKNFDGFVFFCPNGLSMQTF
jgi:hypothetical protein